MVAVVVAAAVRQEARSTDCDFVQVKEATAKCFDCRCLAVLLWVLIMTMVEDVWFEPVLLQKGKDFARLLDEEEPLMEFPLLPLHLRTGSKQTNRPVAGAVVVVVATM